ncbi:hypothetical protein QJS04_geneDACA004863 [Acorus gramineus]|uniref:Uncharacterized protein n=1 Tax=Acorus gramineus TaxID=55184 RepID=A0AAV9BSY3_ACOGR|nr:hypothetical protein QJS04_geneDACA004863 [Acorus gramineus]
MCFRIIESISVSRFLACSLPIPPGPIKSDGPHLPQATLYIQTNQTTHTHTHTQEREIIDALLLNRLVSLTAATKRLLGMDRRPQPLAHQGRPFQPLAATDPPTQSLRSGAQKSALTSRASMMLRQSRPLGGCHVDGGEAVEVYSVLRRWVDGGDGFGWRTDGMGGWRRGGLRWYARQDSTALDGTASCEGHVWKRFIASNKCVN